jgi:hypothetical protein
VEHVGGNVNGLASDLVGPSTVVAEAGNDGTDVAAGHGDGLAVVEGLDSSEEVEVGLGEVGKLKQQLAAGVGGRLAPCGVEGLAGGGDG